MKMKYFFYSITKSTKEYSEKTAVEYIVFIHEQLQKIMFMLSIKKKLNRLN